MCFAHLFSVMGSMGNVGAVGAAQSRQARCCWAVAPARAGSTSSFIPAWTRKNSSLGKTWGTAAKIHALGMWVQCGSPARSQKVPGVAFCTAGKGLFGAVTCAWRCGSSQKRVRGCRDHPKDMRAHAWCDPVLYSLNAIC